MLKSKIARLVAGGDHLEVTVPTTVRLGTDSSGRAILMTPLMAAWWDEFSEACEAKGFTPVVTQGAFMAQAGGGAAASAGYHDLGGCLDLRVWDRTDEQRQFMVRQARRMGAGAWIRDQKHGGMDDHLHLVLGVDNPLSIGAAAQWQAYLRGEDGLAGGGEDYHWRPTPLVTTWRPTPPPTVNITAALQAKTPEARKRALRRVIRSGKAPARAAAKAWLSAILAREAAAVKAKAARGELKAREIR